MDKKHVWRYFGNFIFFSAAFFLFELMLRISTPGQFDVAGFLFSVIFNCITAVFICSLLSLSSGKFHTLLSNLILLLVSSLYISQIIYYNVFGTFYNSESLFNAGQVADFWNFVIIVNTIITKIVYILICLIPIVIYNIFVRKTLITASAPGFRRLTRMDAQWFSQTRNVVLGISAAAYLFMITAFVPFASDPSASYSMFFGQQDYEESINKTGFLSTLKVDVLKVFIKEDSSAALHVLEELRDENHVDYTVFQSDPVPPVTTPPPQVSTGTAGDEYPPEEPPEPIVYGYNVMDINFSELIENETNPAAALLHEYFAGSYPSLKNEYTGMFEGYNLVMFVAEGFSPHAVREDLTPTLYKMVNEGFNFTEFYTSYWRVSTSDGEYVACTGLIPKSGVWSFYRSHSNYLPFVMGNQLRNIGYKTVAYHNHTHTYYRRHLSHPNMGYDFKAVGSGLELPNIVWPNSDFEMLQATVDDYINHQPFHAYYMTVSGHFEYTFGGNMMSRRNRDAVEHLPLSDSAKAYIACHIELDKALEYLMKRLNEAGIAENTVIVLSTDHHPYGLPGNEGADGISEFLGYQVDQSANSEFMNFDLFRNNLIIYAQGMEPVTVDKPSSSLDIIPTVSNLMGLEFDSRFLMGRDILSNSEPLVIFGNRSFITANGRRIRDREFIPNPGVTVDENYADTIRAIVDAKFSVSTSILDLDYYRIVFGQD
ncbi:MAG: LTA synthase family protein [Oscillospiraceae bacterium]|nr:LTA synthase family protein [Oscillospiraceae bacterium]